MANAFGPAYSTGAPNPTHQSLDEAPGGSGGGAVASEGAAIGAIAVATVAPPERLSRAAVTVLARTGASLWSVFTHVARGRVEDAVAVLNRMLEELPAHPTLTRHGPARNWHMHFSPEGASLERRWASDLTIATAMVVGSEGFTRIGSCQAERCERVFLDGTRNLSQTYCSVQCQSRTKTAAMRRRRRAEAESDACSDLERNYETRRSDA